MTSSITPLVPRPETYAELISTFGDPSQYARTEHGIAPQWECAHMYRLALPKPLPLAWDRSILVGRVTVHQLIAPLLEKIYADIDAAGLWDELRDFGGAYNYRAKRGAGSELSLHSWGIAVDHDVARNPLGSGMGEMHPSIVAIFEVHGFVWGGRFKRRTDPMHFQYAAGVL
jgi:hypothetical protein